MAEAKETLDQIMAKLRAHGITDEQIDDLARQTRDRRVFDPPEPVKMPPIRETVFSEPVEQLDEVLERLKRIEDKLDRLSSST